MKNLEMALVGHLTICNASPSINTTSESVMASGDLVRYTARINKNRACALMRVLDDRTLMLIFKRSKINFLL